MCICVWLFGVRDALRDICRNMMEYGMISRRIWYLNLHDWKLHRRFTGFNSTVFWVSHRWRWDVVKNWRSKHTATLAPMNATCTVSSFKSFHSNFNEPCPVKSLLPARLDMSSGSLAIFHSQLKDWNWLKRCSKVSLDVSKHVQTIHLGPQLPTALGTGTQRNRLISHPQTQKQHEMARKTAMSSVSGFLTWPYVTPKSCQFLRTFLRTHHQGLPDFALFFQQILGLSARNLGLSSPAPRKTTPGLEGLGTIRDDRPMCESAIPSDVTPETAGIEMIETIQSWKMLEVYYWVYHVYHIAKFAE